MTKKDLVVYFVNLVDKAGQEFERIDSNCEWSSTMGEMILNSIAYCRKIVNERKGQSIWQTLLSYFKDLPSHLKLPTTTTLINHQPLTLKQDLAVAKRL